MKPKTIKKIKNINQRKKHQQKYEHRDKTSTEKRIYIVISTDKPRAIKNGQKKEKIKKRMER